MPTQSLLSMPPIIPGNIDLSRQPIVKSAGGKTSTVRSMSFEEDGVEILIPTVSIKGKVLSDEKAIEEYRKTGRHLGMFSHPRDATAYARRLSRLYGSGSIPMRRAIKDIPGAEKTGLPSVPFRPMSIADFQGVK